MRDQCASLLVLIWGSWRRIAEHVRSATAKILQNFCGRMTIDAQRGLR